MTNLQLIQSFRTDTNDNTTTFYTDTNILAWLNECLSFVYEEFKPEVKTKTDTINVVTTS